MSSPEQREIPTLQPTAAQLEVQQKLQMFVALLEGTGAQYLLGYFRSQMFEGTFLDNEKMYRQHVGSTLRDIFVQTELDAVLLDDELYNYLQNLLVYAGSFGISYLDAFLLLKEFADRRKNILEGKVKKKNTD